MTIITYPGVLMTQIKKMFDQFYDLGVMEILDHRSWDIPVIAQDNPLVLIIKILKTNDHAWVVDNLKDRHVVGVITEHDLLKGLAPPEVNTYSYGKFNKKVFYTTRDIDADYLMNRDIVQCSSESSVRDVIIKMIDYRVRRIPIVDDGVLKGEITIKNLTNTILAMLTKLEQDAGEPNG